MICPKCGCDNGGYGPDLGSDGIVDINGKDFRVYSCLDCGYSESHEIIDSND